MSLGIQEKKKCLKISGDCLSHRDLLYGHQYDNSLNWNPFEDMLFWIHSIE